MSANFWCWLPALALIPGSPDFFDRVDAAHGPPKQKPAAAIVNFVHDLTRRYPDLSETALDTAWADGPMIGDANGGFIDFTIVWSHYDGVVVPFIVRTARNNGLNCYDPQSSFYYPAEPKSLTGDHRRRSSGGE